MPGTIAKVVLGLADFLLHLADHLVGLAFGLELAVTGHFAGDILHGALHLFAGAFDTILVHTFLLILRTYGKRESVHRSSVNERRYALAGHSSGPALVVSTSSQ